MYKCNTTTQRWKSFSRESCFRISGTESHLICFVTNKVIERHSHYNIFRSMFVSFLAIQICLFCWNISFLNGKCFITPLTLITWHEAVIIIFWLLLRTILMNQVKAVNTKNPTNLTMNLSICQCDQCTRDSDTYKRRKPHSSTFKL